MKIWSKNSLRCAEDFHFLAASISQFTHCLEKLQTHNTNGKVKNSKKENSQFSSGLVFYIHSYILCLLNCH